jgi:LPXTG-site transpeptidase (sortase) family protein
LCMVKGLSLLLLGFGVFVLMQVLMPLVSFKMWEIFAFESEKALVDPAPISTNGDLAPQFQIDTVGNFSVIIGKPRIEKPAFTQFQLSIPKIKLDSSKVMVESLKFDEYLGHLPGSALPGERGNVFITGHSMLPNFATKETKAFFAKLPEVKKGDEVIVDALGQRYVYTVTELKIVDPKDISVVYPPDSTGRYISLMTCVPPGFNTKRLVVVAKLNI